MELLKTIKEEWAVIAMAPFSFVILAVLTFGAAYFFARWRYTAIIDQAKASIDQVKESNAALTERLHLRSEQTESYREKAAKYDEKLAEVVDSGTPELKEKTLKLVSDIREFVARYQRLDQSSQTGWTETQHAKSEDEKRRLWEKTTSSIINHGNERNAEYERRFKVDTLMLRDELLSRLPDYKSEMRSDFVYERPTNDFGFNAVANDLEKMAKSL